MVAQVRIQLGQGSATTVARRMIKNEGLRAFYKVSHNVFIVFESCFLTKAESKAENRVILV
jgi:hypothetical protein